MHLETLQQTRRDPNNILNELNGEIGSDNLTNVSLESASINRKSYLRIIEGVNLGNDAVSCVALGTDQKLQAASSAISMLLRDSFGGNSQTTMILCLKPSAVSHQQQQNILDNLKLAFAA